MADERKSPFPLLVTQEQHFTVFGKEGREVPAERELLFNNEWLSDLGFLTDIARHLNNLNMKLKGSNKLFTSFVADVASFKLRLKLLVAQMAQRKLENFEHLKE